MKHIVLIKLNDKCDFEEVFDNALRLSKTIKNNNDFILSSSFKKNIIERDGNYDLILSVEIKDISFFQEYLNCKEHKSFSSYLKPYVLNKVKIDF